MSDASWLLVWTVLFVVGVGTCVVLHKLGLRTTYARDLLHIGTGIWVLGWPYWNGAATPVALVGVAAILTATVPAIARMSPRVARIEKSFAAGDELWSGLTIYALSYTVLTGIGLLWNPFAAAAGVLVLAMGDGIGGAVGRRFGRHSFRVPGGKTKSFEGSFAVALASAGGVAIAAWRFDQAIALIGVLGIGVGAAVVEALSPRGMDNAFVPAAGWGLAELVT